MPDDLVPLPTAASRLAYGEDDPVEHRTRVNTVREIPNGGGRKESFYWAWPELDREQNWLIEQKLAGKLEIVARRCDDRSRTFRPTPDDLWRWNDWSIGADPPFPIYKPPNPVDKSGGPDTAEWCDPHVVWSDVEQLTGSKPAPTAATASATEIKEAIKHLAQQEGRRPTEDRAWEFARANLPGKKVPRSRLRKALGPGKVGAPKRQS